MANVMRAQFEQFPSSLKSRPWRARHAAATAGAWPTERMWSHFAIPIGPRASAMEMSTPNSLKVRTTHRRAAAEIDHRAGPVQNHGFQAFGLHASLLSRLSGVWRRRMPEQIGHRFFRDRKGCAGARAAGNHHQPDAGGRYFDECVDGTRRVETNPAFDDARSWQIEDKTQFVQDELVNVLRLEGIGGGNPVMAVADDERTVFALDRDQVNAAGQMRWLLRFQPGE